MSLLFPLFITILPNVISMDIVSSNKYGQQISTTTTGNDQILTMTCKKNEVFSNYDSINDFNVITENWNVTQTYLKFTDIFGEEVQVTVEDSYDNGSKNCQNEKYATSFTIYEDTNLLGFSAYIYDQGSDAEGLRVRIYTASWSGTLIAPNTAYFYSEFISTVDIPNFVGWQNIDIPDVFLNTSETNNNTFFIELFGSAGEDINWYYESDAINGDQSYAYVYSSGWFLTDNGDDLIDLALKVNLSNYSPSPSEINMQVNGMDVSDSSVNGEGVVTLSETYVGSSINFDVTANSFINYTVNLTCDFQNQTTITPTSSSSGTDTEWNLNFAGNFLSDSTNKEIKVTIGADWTSTKVYLDSIEYSDVSVDYENNEVVINNITQNGSWNVKSIEEVNEEPEPPNNWWRKRLYWFIRWIFHWKFR